MAHKVITIWIGEGKDWKGRTHKPLPYAKTETPLNRSALPTPKGTMSVMEVVQDQIEDIKKGTAGLFLLPGGRS